MKRLPLYDGDLAAVIERSDRLDVNSTCTRCEFYAGARKVCMPAEGTPGGLLVVGDYPGRDEEAAGRPFFGKTGAYIRGFLAKHWSGPIALDNAIRCVPKGEITEEHVNACRPYLSRTVDQVQATRVFAMGATAIEAVLGRSLKVMSVRRGYGWTSTGVPVFLFPNPVVALRNRILRARLEDSMHWALSVDVSTLVKPSDFGDFFCVETPEDAASAVAVLAMSPWVSYDTETAGVMFDSSFSLLSVALASPRGEVFVWGQSALQEPAVCDPLVQFLSDSRLKKIGQNLKYDLHAIELGLGVQAKGCVGDTQLWRHLLESDVDASLEYQAELVGLGGHKEEAQVARDAAIKTIRVLRAARKKLGSHLPYKAVLETARGSKAWRDLPNAHLLEGAFSHPDTEPEKWAYGMIPEDVLLRYNARDALTTAQVGRLLETQVRADPGASHVWDSVVLGATEAIQRVEAWGMLVDRQALLNYQQHLADLRKACEAQFAAYPDFNPASTPAVRNLLYKELKLEAPKLTDKGAASTDAAALQLLGAKYPNHKVLQALLEWRKIAKLDGTYAKGLEEHIRSDGRIHPTLKIDGAASGRLSCKAPNLQNIPRVDSSSVWGRYPRGIFVPAVGSVYLQVDYSQLELRIAAMLSQDPDMIQIFKDGVDYHQRTAELIAPAAWKIQPSQVTKEHRTKAKTINFGVLYGMKAGALAARMQCSEREAETTMRALFGQFRVLNRWIQDALQTTQRTGYAWTWWAGRQARRRDLSDIAENDAARRINAENSSANTPIQGTASDFCLRSVVEVVRWIEHTRAPAKLVLTVHDSLLLEVQESHLAETAIAVRDIMCGWDSGGVPLAVDMEVGNSWGTLEKYVL